jgi:hypothetical protein
MLRPIWRGPLRRRIRSKIDAPPGPPSVTVSETCFRARLGRSWRRPAEGFGAVFDGQELEVLFPFSLDEGTHRFGDDEDHGGDLSALHHLKCDRMREESLVDIDPEPAENEWARIGCRRPLRIEVDLLAGELGAK